MTDLPRLPEAFAQWRGDATFHLSVGHYNIDDYRDTELFTASQMLDLQRATLEWAAKQCELVNSTTGECPEMAVYCAQAIREGLKADHL